MPDLRPFRAVRYAERAGDPSDLLAPPYDVIDPEQAERLRERSPFNAVRLVLPQGEDRYERAARRLEDWLEEGLLLRDDEPAVWIYGQAFEREGRKHTRHGVFAALRLSDFGRGEVLPHERTHRAPKEDRLRLMEACGAQLSPVFLVAPDPGDRLPALLERTVRDAPVLEARTPDGLRHRLWRVPEGPLAEELCEAAGAAPALIADGHHRYETALALQRRRPDDASAAWTLACLVGASDPGLLCLPTHRALRRPPPAPRRPNGSATGPEPRPEGRPAPGAREAWTRLLEASFEVRPAGLPPGAAGEAARLAAREGSGAMVALPADGPGLLLRAPDAGREAEGGEVAPALFERLVLRRAFDLSPDAAVERTLLSYHRAPSEAAAAAGGEGAAFLLPPLEVDRVLEVARRGGRLPPKSTYFWPKLPSGLLFRTLTA